MTALLVHLHAWGRALVLLFRLCIEEGVLNTPLHHDYELNVVD